MRLNASSATAREVAIRHGHLDLLSVIPSDFPGSEQRQAEPVLVHQTRRRRISTVRQLLRDGADPNTVVDERQALHIAAIKGFDAIACLC